MAKVAKRRIAVLGGAGGIGRALVERLTRMGDEVIVLDMAASLARYPASVSALEVDIRSEKSVREAVEGVSKHFQALDGLVFISGIRGNKQELHELDLDHFDEIIKVNLRGYVLAAKLFLPLLIKGSDSSFVIMSSAIAGKLLPTYGAYTISKTGLMALTKQLALELAPGVRVNAVAPSAVDTAFSRGGTGSDESEPPTDYESLKKLIPMGRVAVADDIVGPIVFLLGDDSRYMTGQVLWITGGMYMP